MKIMLVSRVWSSQRGGGMIHVVHDRAVELARQGHEVHVVTTSDTPTAGQVRPAVDRIEHDCAVHYTESPGHNWSDDFAQATKRWADRLMPDIIHSDSLDPENIWWWPGNKHRVSVTMHGVRFGTFLTRWNELRAFGKISHGASTWGSDPKGFMYDAIMAEINGLRAAHRVIGVSRWEWRLLRDQYALESARLVYNPIAPYFFHPPADPAPARSGFLCAAVSQGGTRGFSAAEQAAKRAGAELRVLTKAPRTEMPAVLDRVKAIVLPTAFCQGYDLTVCEARARGTPAIMSPTGSYLSEADGDYDTLVNFGDVDGLAEAMRRARSDGGQFDVRKHRPEGHVSAWLDAVQ